MHTKYPADLGTKGLPWETMLKHVSVARGVVFGREAGNLPQSLLNRPAPRLDAEWGCTISGWHSAHAQHPLSAAVLAQPKHRADAHTNFVQCVCVCGYMSVCHLADNAPTTSVADLGTLDSLVEVRL